jgi:hypothetical protein
MASIYEHEIERYEECHPEDCRSVDRRCMSWGESSPHDDRRDYEWNQIMDIYDAEAGFPMADPRDTLPQK